MRITDLMKGDRILCCDIEQAVEHVALHPSGTRVIFTDGGSASAEHLDECGWTLIDYTMPAELREALEAVA